MTRHTYEIEVTDAGVDIIEAMSGLAEVESVDIVRDGPTHKLDVGCWTMDKTEPTPSPEANAVKVVELTNTPAEEFVVEETGKTVAEHNPGYPPNDPVVGGVYPNMGGDQTFHFPESRLRKI